MGTLRIYTDDRKLPHEIEDPHRFHVCNGRALVVTHPEADELIYETDSVVYFDE